MNLASLYRFRSIGPLILRLAFGFQLIKVSYPYAFSPDKKMPEFMSYLTSLGFPFPTIGAYLSVYTELIGGILLLLGLWTRWASTLLIINFSIAVGMAHLAINDTYQNTFPSVNLLAVCIFLLFNGPGKPSLDEGIN
ncbi:DoxX family protein [Spirosoma endbachense]|uniref:DoxX family membrane protein n=1 Tax=Spirosoma endbachense TaxID=2666025 RepID=A0A6P1W409_9BACT|nr:DoxX family protein [Spirosoma endbachense]QHV99624.1 DoxX family membrane protein [Spirosoma endbachense]